MTNKDKQGSSFEFVTVQDDSIQQEKLKRDHAAAKTTRLVNEERRSGAQRRDGVDRREMIRFEDERREANERRLSAADWNAN